jgi:ligand-binding SRPBCC domain-containing protein
VAVPLNSLRTFHESSEALHQLTPKFLRLEVKSADLAVRPGNRIETCTGIWPVRVKWVAMITHADENGFHDISVEGPFRVWSHWHRFEADGSHSALEDEIEYETGFGKLADALAGLGLRLLFAYRHRVTRQILGG